MRIHLNNKPFIICLLYIVICNTAYTQETYIYDARDKRDPFVPPVGIVPLAEGKKIIEFLEDIVSIEDVRLYVRLQGIARDATGKKVAILNGEMVEEGETVGHLTVKRIFKNEVTLSVDKEEHKLNIYEAGEGG